MTIHINTATSITSSSPTALNSIIQVKNKCITNQAVVNIQTDEPSAATTIDDVLFGPPDAFSR